MSSDDNVIDIWIHKDPNADINEMKNFVEADKPESARRCPHSNVLVSEFERSISCRVCHAALDPFDYLLSLAKKETRLDWELRALRGEIKIRRDNLANLKREEVNTRGRIRNAQFKLNDIQLAIDEASDTLIKKKGHHEKA